MGRNDKGHEGVRCSLPVSRSQVISVSMETWRIRMKYWHWWVLWPFLSFDPVLASTRQRSQTCLHRGVGTACTQSQAGEQWARKSVTQKPGLGKTYIGLKSWGRRQPRVCLFPLPTSISLILLQSPSSVHQRCPQSSSRFYPLLLPEVMATCFRSLLRAALYFPEPVSVMTTYFYITDHPKS